MKYVKKILVSFIFLWVLFSCVALDPGKVYINPGEIDLIKLLAPPPTQDQTYPLK